MIFPFVEEQASVREIKWDAFRNYLEAFGS
jgi:hypothetical protein